MKAASRKVTAASAASNSTSDLDVRKLHDAATKAEEIAIPLDAALDLIYRIIGYDAIDSDNVHLGTALRSVLEEASEQQGALTALLYEVALGKQQAPAASAPDIPAAVASVKEGEGLGDVVDRLENALGMLRILSAACDSRNEDHPRPTHITGTADAIFDIVHEAQRIVIEVQG